MTIWPIVATLILTTLIPVHAAKKKGGEYGNCGKIKGAFRGKFWHYYARGESFADCDFWEEAAEDFEGALKRRDKDKKGARTYGMRYLNYYPHRELGVCYYKLGRYEEARRELELSLSQVETDKTHYYLERTKKAIASSGDDHTAPSITFTNPAQGDVTNSRLIDLSIQVSDNSFVDTIKVNGRTIEFEGDQTVQVKQRVALESGENIITVEASDLNNNVSTGELSITLDKEGPIVAVDRPTGLDPIPHETVEVAGVVTDPMGIHSLKFGDKALEVGLDGSFATQVLLQEGENTIQFITTDKLGNDSVGRIYLTRGEPSASGPSSVEDPKPVGDPASEVEEPPEFFASLAADPTTGRVPLDVTFSAGASGSGELTYLWDFGDGGTSAELNPTHTYDRFGNYAARVTVTDAWDRVIVQDQAIQVQALEPIASVAADTVKGIVPLTVAFTSDIGPPGPNLGRISYSWDFGDGDTANVANPVHAFEDAGTYSAILTISGPGGTGRASIQIEVLPPGVPDGTLAAIPDTGTVPLTVRLRFTPSQTSGPIESVSWNLGDGNSSAEESPNHTFTSPGTYDVSVILTGPGGGNQIGRNITVNERRPAGLLTAQPTSGFTPLNVTFTFEQDDESGPITGYTWDLGDGNSSNEQNHTHTYSAAGTYSVSLNLVGPGGNLQLIEKNLINVSHPGEILAGMQSSPLEGLAPLTVTFTNLSKGEGTLTYRWDFGDGSTSTDPNPTHTFEQFGEYPVSLSITDALNRAGQNTQHIRALASPPIVAISSDVVEGSVPLRVNFRSEVGPKGPNLGNVEYTWDFGDGNSDHGKYPTNTFSEPGTYTVSLSVTGPGGTTCSDQMISALPPPEPNGKFAADPSAGYGPLTTTFRFTPSINSGPIQSFAWDFGDGGKSSEQNPSYTYTEPDLYTVSLTLVGPGGKKALTRQNFIKVEHQLPAGSLAANRTSGTAPFSAGFSFIPDPGGGPVETYYWDFGDGSSSRDANPIHSFEQPGDYTLTVTLTGPGGKHKIVKKKFIRVKHAVAVSKSGSLSGPGAVSGPTPINGSASEIAPPAIRLIDLTDNQVVFTNQIRIDGTVTDRAKVKEIRINGQKLKVNKATIVTFSNNFDLNVGKNTFSVAAVNGKGLKTTQTIKIVREEQETNKRAAKLSVAVPPFVAPKELPTELTAGLDRAFMNSLEALKRFNIVERGALQDLIDEKKLGQTGLVDKKTVAKLGQMSGAEAIFIGTVSEKKNNVTIYVQLVDVRTGELILGKEAFDENKEQEQITFLIDKLARRFKQSLPRVTGEVIMIDGDNITVDRGAVHGLRRLLPVTLFREGKQVIIPSTGKVLGRKNKRLGESVVIAAEDEFSELASVPSSGVRVGDKVITK